MLKKYAVPSILAFIMLLGSVLLLGNLSNGMLWNDEAVTAVLAKNVLTYGYPRVFDGKNYVLEFEDGRDTNKHLAKI